MIKVGKVVEKTTFVVSMISYCGIIAIMLLNVGDVLMTKIFIKPITGAYEITECLLLCTVIASFAYAQSKKSHINMTLVIKFFPRSLKFLIYGLMGILSTATAAYRRLCRCTPGGSKRPSARAQSQAFYLSRCIPSIT